MTAPKNTSRHAAGDVNTTIAWVASREQPFRIRGWSAVYTARTPLRFTVKHAYRLAKGNPWILALLLPAGIKTKIRRDHGNAVAQAIMREVDEYKALKGQGVAVPPFRIWREQPAKRRRTKAATTATTAHQQNANDRQARIIEQWRALEGKGVAERNRSALIAKNINVNRSTVNRVIKSRGTRVMNDAQIKECKSSESKIPS
jgi:hypothetical protein